MTIPVPSIYKTFVLVLTLALTGLYLEHFKPKLFCINPDIKLYLKASKLECGLVYCNKPVTIGG